MAVHFAPRTYFCIKNGLVLPNYHDLHVHIVFGSATYRNASAAGVLSGSRSITVYLLEDPSFTLSVHRQTDSQGHVKIPAGGRYAVGVVGSDGRVGLSSDGRWEKDVWEGSPLPQAPRAKRFRRVGWGGVDEIDVIFLCAWLAAPVELRGSRTRVGRYRRRRRGTPNADDNLACVGMKIGFVAVSGFSERADSAYNGGGKSMDSLTRSSTVRCRAT